MSDKWTPGPWSISETWRPPIYGVPHTGDRTDGRGNVFWGYSISGSDEHGASILPTLAAVHNFPDQIEANARLISASPTMYAYIAKKAQEGDADAARIIAAI